MILSCTLKPVFLFHQFIGFAKRGDILTGKADLLTVKENISSDVTTHPSPSKLKKSCSKRGNMQYGIAIYEPENRFHTQ